MKTLIVARFNEPLEWLSRVPEDWAIVIVDKGECWQPPADILALRWGPDRLKCLGAPNVGREAATFLNAIRAAQSGASATDPGDLFAFFQGNPNDHAADAIEQLAITPNRGGFREFGRTFVCDKMGAPHDRGKRVGAGYEFIFEKHAPESYRFIVGGQFMTTAENIRALDPAILARAYAVCTEWPDGPWIIERLWLHLFGKENE